jgi:hydrogenase maturation protein HypF
MGENGELWGGECLRVNYRECEHLGGLPAVALPGGDLAARQPWRNLLAHCLAFVPDWQNYADTAALRQQSWPLLARASSAVLMRRRHRRAAVCLTPSPARWAARRSP